MKGLFNLLYLLNNDILNIYKNDVYISPELFLMKLQFRKDKKAKLTDKIKISFFLNILFVLYYVYSMDLIPHAI